MGNPLAVFMRQRNFVATLLGSLYMIGLSWEWRALKKVLNIAVEKKHFITGIPKK